MPEETTESPLSLVSLLEAILFVADGPVAVDALAKATGAPSSQVGSALDELRKAYQERGLRIQFQNGSVQLVTAPEAAPVVERFLASPRPNRLSAAALETLSIVAYRGPITRSAIDALRGIESNAVVGTLLARGLIEEVGHAESLGRPAILAVTDEFLRYFGLESESQLPHVSDP